MSAYWCPQCGMVVKGVAEPPFCRHSDPELVAARMVPLPPWHPSRGRSGTPDEMAVDTGLGDPWEGT